MAGYRGLAASSQQGYEPGKEQPAKGQRSCLTAGLRDPRQSSATAAEAVLPFSLPAVGFPTSALSRLCRDKE